MYRNVRKLKEKTADAGRRVHMNEVKNCRQLATRRLLLNKSSKT